MKNSKSRKRASKGALCACKDHFAMAEGGSVPTADNMKLTDLPALLRAYLASPSEEKPGAMTDEAYDARLLGPRRPMRASGGRRPEALNASRDVNMPAQMLRGWAAGTLGLPGDLEGLARMAIPGVSNKPFFPTSEDYDSILPGRDMSPAGRFAGGAGTLFGGAGLPAITRGVQKGSKVVAKGALETLARGMEGQGPLSGVLAPAAPRYAVRPRGGNFTNPRTEDLGGWFAQGNSPQEAWATKVLRNYVKRDLGAPTDPLLALEKEIPGLHLGEELMGERGGDVDWLYDQRNRLRANDPKRPASLLDEASANVLDRHEALSGGARLTPWGRISDAEVLSGTAGQDLAVELSNKWPMATMYPDMPYQDVSGTEALKSLRDHTSAILSRDPEAQSLRGVKLREYSQQIDDAMANDWRAKKPEDPLYSFMAGGGERLGFDHIMDYIDAATSPYSRTKGVGSSINTPEEMAAQAKRYIADLEGGARDIQQWPMRRESIDEDLGMVRAGLHLDPASLDRVSVPDMVRKVAKWNEYMASKKAGNADELMQGARVFKEYGPEAGDAAGMKWVEFGKPEEKFFTADNLPEGYKLVKSKNGTLPEDHPGAYNYWVSDAADRAPQGDLYSINSEPEKALEAFRHNYHQEKMVGPLRTGLKAEGDAMGHCVGGYCDDVIERGTKIYSLRDAKGSPHVTVEVRPSDVRDYLRTLPHPAPRGVQNPNSFTTFSDYVNDMRQGNGDYEQVAKTLMVKHNIPPPPDQIVQIKGKGNAAPVEKYLPAVQDFVKSGTWGRVGDLGNTGLRKPEDVFGASELRQIRAAGVEIPKYLDSESAIAISRAGGFTDSNAEDIIRGAFSRAYRGYAHGGSVTADPNGPGSGFIPRTFEEAVDYAERVYALHA